MASAGYLILFFAECHVNVSASLECLEAPREVRLSLTALGLHFSYDILLLLTRLFKGLLMESYYC